MHVFYRNTKIALFRNFCVKSILFAFCLCYIGSAAARRGRHPAGPRRRPSDNECTPHLRTSQHSTCFFTYKCIPSDALAYLLREVSFCLHVFISNSRTVSVEIRQTYSREYSDDYLAVALTYFFIHIRNYYFAITEAYLPI